MITLIVTAASGLDQAKFYRLSFRQALLAATLVGFPVFGCGEEVFALGVRGREICIGRGSPGLLLMSISGTECEAKTLFSHPTA